MVVILKKEASKDEIAALEQTLYSKDTHAGFDAKKYNGVLQIQDDPLAIQKKLRDEWERNFS